MTTIIVCIKRKASLSHEEFTTYWRTKHGPLVRSCKDFTRHLKSYTQHSPVDRDSPVAKLFGSSAEYDGIAVLEFKSIEAMHAAFSEPAYLADVQPDEPRFIDIPNCLSLITKPTRIVDEGNI